jgi:hypothetical protein
MRGISAAAFLSCRGTVAWSLPPRSSFLATILLWYKMDVFLRDYYGHRCSSGRKSGDVFNDYLDVKKVVQLSKPSWHLHKLVTIAEY